MKVYEIWSLAEHGLFEDSIYSPIFLITEIDDEKISGYPVFFGDSMANNNDVKINLNTDSYKNVWIDSTFITIHVSSCLKKLSDVDDGALSDIIGAQNGSMSVKRGRVCLEDGDPLAEAKAQMKDFFMNYSETSFSRHYESIPDIIKKGIRSLLTFDVADLVMQQASGGNRVESRVVEKNSIEINYSLERRIDQDGDLVISINGRANIKSDGDFRIWLVLAKDDKELFRKKISIDSEHFEEYYYREELVKNALDPENVMESLEKGDLKCYLIIDSGIEG